MSEIYVAKFGEGEQYKDRYTAAKVLRKFTNCDSRLYRTWRDYDKGYVVKYSHCGRIDTVTVDYFPTFVQRCILNGDKVMFINNKESLVGVIK